MIVCVYMCVSIPEVKRDLHVSLCERFTCLIMRLPIFSWNHQVARCHIKVELVNESFTELRGEIAGPPDTPYEGGTYVLEIKIPETYPFNPPKVRFITKIWHPNISSVTGAICLDILKDQWAAAMTLRTVLLSLQVKGLRADDARRKL